MPLSVGQRLAEMLVAKAWGIPPHKWDLMPVASRAEMMATHDVEGLMGSYRMEERTNDN